MLKVAQFVEVKNLKPPKWPSVGEQISKIWHIYMMKTIYRLKKQRFVSF